MRTTLIAFGDRFSNPEKDWIVVASEAAVRAFVLRQHLNVQNVLCLRSGFPEDLDKDAFPNVGDYARATAGGKAQSVAERIFGATTPEQKQAVLNDIRNPFGAIPEDFDLDKIKVVIAADTVCYCCGNIFEKPASKEEARIQLQCYQKEDPQMVTGVSAYARSHGLSSPVFSFYDIMSIRFQRMSEEDIEAYLELGDWVGASGSFKITSFGESVIDRIEGCYTTCVGMPANKVSKYLAKFFNEHEG